MNPLLRVCLLTVLLTLSVTTARAQDEKEPVHDGKPLSQWIKKLESKDSRERYDACSAVGQLGPKARAAVPAVMEVLKDKDLATRSLAAYALGQIGPEAKAAVPAVI